MADAEMLQKILHRYVAIDRSDAIQPAFDALLGVVDEVLIVDRRSARDALYLSVMEQNGIRQIASFDSGFDAFPGVARLS